MGSAERRTSRRRSILALIAVLAVAGGLTSVSSAAAAGPVSVVSGPTVDRPIKGVDFTFGYRSSAAPGSLIHFDCSTDSTELSSCNGFYPAKCNSICGESVHIGVLAEGQHVFRVGASTCLILTDCDEPADWTHGPILEHAFMVDRTPPVVSIVSSPTMEHPALTLRPHIAISSNEPVSLLCALKRGMLPTYGFLPCDNGVVKKPLRNGVYTLHVVAVDIAKNDSAKVMVHFRVDAFTPRKCKRGKSDSSRAAYRRCKAANRRAKQRWKRRNGIGSAGASRND